MTARDWILQVALGGLFGAVGQSVRVLVGLKKLNDQAVHAGRLFAELFSLSTLLISILVGFVAGVLGTLAQPLDLQAVTRENVMVLMGIGYSGADFIEGFVRKRLPIPAAGPADAGKGVEATAARDGVSGAPHDGVASVAAADALAAAAPPVDAAPRNGSAPSAFEAAPAESDERPPPPVG